MLNSAICPLLSIAFNRKLFCTKQLILCQLTPFNREQRSAGKLSDTYVKRKNFKNFSSFHLTTITLVSFLPLLLWLLISAQYTYVTVELLQTPYESQFLLTISKFYSLQQLQFEFKYQEASYAQKNFNSFYISILSVPIQNNIRPQN